MASLAEIINTFLAAQIRPRAVNGGDAAALQLVQRKADGMEIGGNQPAETLAHQKIKASDGCQGGRAEVHFSAARLQLAHLFQCPLLQQIAQAAQAVQLAGGLLQRFQPPWRMRAHFAKQRLQDLSDLFESDTALVKSRGSAQTQILHQQEVDLVAISLVLLFFLQMMGDQRPQIFLSAELRGLQ